MSGWYYLPGRGEHHPQPLIRLYCSVCERYSRAVRPPSEAQKRAVRHARGLPEHTVIWPDAPRGWEGGCPRCRPAGEQPTGRGEKEQLGALL